MLNHLLIKLINFEIDFKVLKNEVLYLNNILNLNFNTDKIQNLLINFEALYNKLKIKYNFNTSFFMIYNNKLFNIYIYFKNIISTIFSSDLFIYVK
jgi:hypothetical protein